MRVAILIIFVISLGVSTITAQTKKSVDTTIVEKVDVVPQFSGGAAAWRRFLTNNMDVSKAAAAMDSTAYVQYGLKQTAVMEFTVCEDGEVCDVKVINKDKISPEFAKEVLRVMKKSPKWMPAMLNGQPVKTRFRQPIMAILQDE